MAKKVLILIRRSPFSDIIASEALRMSIGLTLTDNEITVVFQEDAVSMLTAVIYNSDRYADIKRHIETLGELNCKLIMEKQASNKVGEINKEIDVIISSRTEIDDLIAESDHVITF